jgi:hypothetical protein
MEKAQRNQPQIKVGQVYRYFPVKNRSGFYERPKDEVYWIIVEKHGSCWKIEYLYHGTGHQFSGYGPFSSITPATLRNGEWELMHQSSEQFKKVFEVLYKQPPTPEKPLELSQGLKDIISKMLGDFIK